MWGLGIRKLREVSGVGFRIQEAQGGVQCRAQG